MNGVLRLLLVGPAAVLALTSLLAALALFAGAAGRMNRLAALGAKASARCSHARPLLLPWGLSATGLALLLTVILVNIKVLALFGLAVVVLGLTLAGFGLGVAAARCGRRLAAILGHPSAPPLLTFALGLTTFFLAAFLPFLGWLPVLLATLTGVGATLDALLRRE